ncbi:MAG: hypothetical protein JST15_07000 [Bacteroidetes bacterium]|nr:hypothetical protein [Bacteroidota bacterium]
MENINDKNIKSSKEIEYELAVYGIRSAFEINFDSDEQNKINSKANSIKNDNKNFNKEFNDNSSKLFIQ